MEPENKYRTALLRRPKRQNSGATTVASPRLYCSYSKTAHDSRLSAYHSQNTNRTAYCSSNKSAAPHCHFLPVTGRKCNSASLNKRDCSLVQRQRTVVCRNTVRNCTFQISDAQLQYLFIKLFTATYFGSDCEPSSGLI
jgi:hypothetical protein